MCNSLHSNSVPIPKTGYGWKIVNIDREGNIYAAVLHVKYKSGKDGIIKWDEKDGGFCFFLSKKEAIRANIAHVWPLNLEQKIIKIKIRYGDGLGKHNETKFIGGYSFEIALCKKFRFIK